MYARINIDTATRPRKYSVMSKPFKLLLGTMLAISWLASSPLQADLMTGRRRLLITQPTPLFQVDASFNGQRARQLAMIPALQEVLVLKHTTRYGKADQHEGFVTDVVWRGMRGRILKGENVATQWKRITHAGKRFVAFGRVSVKGWWTGPRAYPKRQSLTLQPPGKDAYLAPRGRVAIIRAKPHSGTPSLAEVERTEACLLLSRSGAWFKVISSGGILGYVQSSSVRPASEYFE